MKNFRKVLALVLVVATLFSFTAMAGAVDIEDFSDKDQISHVEAVDVLTSLNILEGDESVAFNPTSNVTRAEAATIIARLVLTRKTADAKVASSTSFSDMKGHWANNYVETCVKMGIVNGMGDGTFEPNGPVTGYQFAKMLLCAIGYGAKNEFVGQNWDTNVAKTGQSLNMFTGTAAMDMNAPATREECALYAFNVLTAADIVTFSSAQGSYTPGTTPQTLGEKQYGLGCAETLELTAPDNRGFYTIGTVRMAAELGEHLGRSVRVWYIQNGSVCTAVSNAYYCDVVLGENHFGYTYSDMTSARKSGFLCRAESASKLQVYINGSRFDKNGKAYTTAHVGGKKGVKVTFVDSAKNGAFDGVADKVFVLEKQAVQLSDDPSVRNGAIMIPGITDGYEEASNIIAPKNLGCGHVVLYWTDAVGKIHIELADNFTGKLTGTNVLPGDTGYIINKETYQLSDVTGAAAMTRAMYDVPLSPTAANREFTYYTDNGGYIIAASAVNGEASDYVVIADLDVIESQDGNGDAYIQALLVDMNGAKKIVRLETVIVASSNVDSNGQAVSSVKYSGRGANAENLLNTSAGAGNYAVNANVVPLVGNTFFTYAQNNEIYSLTSVCNKSANKTKTEVGSLSRTDGSLNDITNGKTAFAADLTGNASTKFVIYNKSTDRYDVYAGVSKVPSVELSSTSETGYIAFNGIARYVFIGKNAIESISNLTSENLFLLSTNPISEHDSTSAENGYGVYAAAVNGKQTTVKIRMSKQDVATCGIGYKTAQFDGEYAISLSGNTLGLAPKVGYTISGSTIRLASNYAYSYTFTDGVPAYIVDTKRSSNIESTAVTSLTGDDNDLVYVVLPSVNASRASFVVILKNDPRSNVSITSQPVSASYAPNEEAVSLSVTANAANSQSNELCYQWYKGANNNHTTAEKIAGATSSALASSMISTAKAGVTYYFCKVTHSRYGMATTEVWSDAAAITVFGDSSTPVVTGNNLTASEDDIVFTATLSQSITGKAALVIEWFGPNGWAPVGTGSCDLADAAEIQYTFESVFHNEGRYKVSYILSQDGNKIISDNFTADLRGE